VEKNKRLEALEQHNDLGDSSCAYGEDNKALKMKRVRANPS
jgi:hypothetical protein